MTDNTTLLPLVQKFFEHDLSAAASVLESMPEEEAAGALKSLPVPLAARVVKVLQISYAAELLKDADEHFIMEMTSHLDSQFLASIMMLLPQDARERMTKHISGELKDQIRELLDYPEGSIGRTMTTDFVALKKRLLWLHINLATAFLAAAVVALFEGIIAQLTILAVFLPVVAGQGGNAGAQSLAVVTSGTIPPDPKGGKHD